MAVPRRAVDLSFEGSNPADCFGGSCAENMCCSVALAKRAGLSGTEGLKDLPDNHDAWDAAAHYLASLCANIVLLASPERIVLSGGVMLRTCLFSKVRERTQAMLNGYIQTPQLTTQAGIDEYLAPSHWGNNAGPPCLHPSQAPSRVASRLLPAARLYFPCASFTFTSRGRRSGRSADSRRPRATQR